ncbi:MAG: glycosyl transferase [Candidatus Schekmanbacteria bacterium GWA2_38_11]|uniref:Glycosyl transferase n=1 Tax=Candidatus Schekmanbacteria bacterium GWA2_38_11 TaxID=1817876 RepID=A0A1F7RHW4_9BACT|nr:MAG: glycosyl transferase [Candidatus Schekmanbacteria bacterium GWA2_38_11]
MDHRVSVIIPTYNRAQLLAEALNSVTSQTYKDFELIVVDDGSSDNTKEVVKNFNGEIKYLYQKNQGVSAARNLGIREAKGEFLSFLDSDDMLERKKLEKQIDFFDKNKEAKVCYTDEIWVRNGKRVNQMKKHAKYSGDIFEKSLPLCIISASSITIKKDVLTRVGLFDESLIVCEDYDLWLRISNEYPVYFIPEKLIIKRGGHKDQLSKKYWGMDRFRIKVLEKLLLEGGLDPSKKDATFKELEKKCEIFSKGCFKRGKIEEGEKYAAIPLKYKVSILGFEDSRVQEIK